MDIEQNRNMTKINNSSLEIQKLITLLLRRLKFEINK